MKRSKKLNNLIFYLLFLANSIYPLAVTPLLSKKFGIDAYGEISFYQSIGMMASIFTDFGFNVTAVRRFAEIKENKVDIKLLIFNILGAKTILFATSSVFIAVLSYFKFLNTPNTMLLVLSVLNFIAISFTMQWFFQGNGMQFRYFFMLFLSKLILLPGIIICTNVVQWFEINLLSSVILLITVWINLHSYAPISQIRFNMVGIFFELKQSINAFSSQIFISMYTLATSIYLGNRVSHYDLAYFSTAEKVTRLASYLNTPIFQIYFPKFIQVFQKNNIDKNKAEKKELFRAIIAIFCIGCCSSAFIYFSAEHISNFFLGERSSKGVNYLHLMAILPVFFAFASIAYYFFIIPMKSEKYLLYVYGFVAMFNLIFLPILTWRFSGYGASYAILTSEILVVILSFFIVFKSRKLIAAYL